MHERSEKNLTRPVELKDLPAVISIHQQAFPGFFLTLLGPRFLERYYRLVMEYSGGIFLIKDGSDGPVGFVSGFINPGEFYSLLRARRSGFLPSVGLQVLRRPWLIRRLMASYRLASRESQGSEHDLCELSSIAVLPNQSGKGPGKALVQAFFAAINNRAKAVVLFTDADGNDAVNKFYLSLGFTLESTIERSTGRRMNRYRISL
jgi:ribosomal protein S18 acetylase RimI-like enzyme